MSNCVCTTHTARKIVSRCLYFLASVDSPMLPSFYFSIWDEPTLLHLFIATELSLFPCVLFLDKRQILRLDRIRKDIILFSNLVATLVKRNPVESWVKLGQNISLSAYGSLRHSRISELARGFDFCLCLNLIYSA